ncbi:hypothetical protein [Actinoplanes sp. NBRC 103695]|uniref:hypothetical protein n=1 Tax=Actinoplanes sp. NBRC 103695 TaxID=3032202 RepID=UPI0024A4103E|nr:hypothetical protein [Actinoplanes sp. NBRC 103695]GLY98199.1 hypothetical protein Acsp02_54530 [Actinoplanes sp. NBRC 103695]
MTPARPFAASVAALGVAGVIAVPAPAFAAPDSCPRWERYAAQSGAELLKIDKLSVRPQREPGSGRDRDAPPGSGDDAQPPDAPPLEAPTQGAPPHGGPPQGAPPHGDSTHGDSTHGGPTRGGGDASSGNGARPRAGNGTQPRGGDAGSQPPGRSSKPAKPGAVGSGQSGDARQNRDDQRGTPKGAQPTDRSSKPADGSLLGKVGGATGIGDGGQGGGTAGQGGGTGGQRGGTSGQGGQGGGTGGQGGGTGGQGGGTGSQGGGTGSPRWNAGNPGGNGGQSGGAGNESRTTSGQTDGAGGRTDGAGGQGGGAGGQGGGAGGQGGGRADFAALNAEKLILKKGAATATSPTPELGGSNVGRGYDSFRQPSTGPDPDAREPREITVRGLHVGEAKSAMIGVAAPNAAAMVRMINSSDRSRVSLPLVQQAPPNKKARQQTTPAAEAGPILMDDGSLTADASWRDGMACGRTVGDITRAAATLGAAQVSGNGDTALVSVPEKTQSVSTTALERTAGGARTVSTASLTAGSFELLDGAVQIKVLRTPMLRTTMSTADGGAVRYQPAAIVVSGEGIRTTTLDAAGDSMEMTFSERRTESARMPDLAVRTLGDLPLPTIPGLPQVPGGATESAPAARPGTSVKISLGKPRQATQGRAIAAKASAITVGIVQGGRTDDGYGHSADLSLDMAIGALESAAVAPEPGGSGGDLESATAGSGGGLPVTGPGIGVMAVIGGTLLASGTVAFLLGRRRRRFEA